MIFLCLPLRFEACYENFPNFEKLISTEGDAVNDYIINISCIRSFFCSYSPEQVQKQPPRVVLRNFEEISHFTGKHLCQSLPFNKIAGLTPATLLKKKLWHGYFPVNFAKFLRTPFLTEHLRWLLLQVSLIYSRICLMPYVFLTTNVELPFLKKFSCVTQSVSYV